MWRCLTQVQGRDNIYHKLLTKTDLPAFPFWSNKEHWPVDATIIMHSLKPHHAVVKCPSLPICLNYCMVPANKLCLLTSLQASTITALFSELSSRFLIFRNAASEISSYFPRDFQLFSHSWEIKPKLHNLSSFHTINPDWFLIFPFEKIRHTCFKNKTKIGRNVFLVAFFFRNTTPVLQVPLN